MLKRLVVTGTVCVFFLLSLETSRAADRVTRQEGSPFPAFFPDEPEPKKWGEGLTQLPRMLRSFNPLSVFIRPSYGRTKYRSGPLESGKKLMIVAHPDDESLWGGCHLMEGGWHVISVTNASHPVRRKEFAAAMNYAGASWEIWDHDDRYFSGRLHPYLSDDIRDVIESYPWEQIVTHGPEGEYGHRQHRSLWALVRKISGRDLWVFNPFSGEEVSKGCKKKKAGLLKHYESQLSGFKYIGHFGPDAGYGMHFESFKKTP